MANFIKKATLVAVLLITSGIINPAQVSAQTLSSQLLKEMKLPVCTGVTCSAIYSENSATQAGEPLLIAEEKLSSTLIAPEVATIPSQSLTLDQAVKPLGPVQEATVEAEALNKVVDLLPSPVDLNDSPPEQTVTITAAEAPLLPVISTPEPTITPFTTTTPNTMPLSQESSTSLDANLIFQMINGHRAQIGLPAFEKDERICKVAQERAPEIYGEIYITYNMHHGFYSRNLPYWASENIIYMNSEANAVNWWLNSPIHRSQIDSPNYQYSCVACAGRACSQVFTSFISK
jgi:uncharacterized protein YkwD